jgi:hypothetical protein
MSNNRYLEFDSTYRNRNEWPLASEFQIPISQSGKKGQLDSLDPVCVSTPIMVWTSNYLDKSAVPPSGTLGGTLLFNTASPPTPISNTSDNQTFVIKTTNNKALQQLENYYVGLVITASTFRRRIIAYKYLYKDGSNKDYGLVTISSSFPDSIADGAVFDIYDPTTVIDTSNPYFFVPAGRIQKNAYTGYLLYNETRQQYRQIKDYDSTAHIISLNTEGTASTSGGPVTGWLVTDNYSIRKQPPYLNTQYTPSSTTSNSIVITTLSSTQVNYYKNYSLRVIPVTNSTNAALSQYYSYVNNIPENSVTNVATNEERIINYSTYNSPNTTLSFSNSFSATPTLVEILPFSYDNFNPFIYTGSMVSQQDMVCYEVELLNLILPNDVLAVGEGGRIAFYPYVYVQISNVSSSNGRLSNIIYSNNPNAVRAIFRVPIDDVINPLISAFIKVDGDGMVQTIKFKPNDNLYFSVFLSNGELYQTIIPENYSPSPPNPICQISASFGIRRL